MKAEAAPVDATRCPLCGEANRCAIELERETGQPQGPCWCMRTPIAAEAALSNTTIHTFTAEQWALSAAVSRPSATQMQVATSSG